MQAAFQESTDNAVSKTINMSNDATVEDIRSAYILAWKSGLKGITVYRDGSKEVQVLETGHKKKNDETRDEKLDKKLPDIMPAVRIRQRSPFGNMHITVVHDPETGKVLENFAQLGKAGEVVSADLEAISRLSSIWYRSGGSIEQVIEQLSGIGSNEGIVSRDGTITSVPDAYARALMKFQTIRTKGYLPSIMDGTADLEAISNEIADEMRTGNGVPSSSSKKGVVKSKCPSCEKGVLSFEEGCKKCHSCGFSQC
jgi:ribonucleoside-diphosphate reductase alpha chain